MTLTRDSLLTWSLEDLSEALLGAPLKIVAVSDASTTIHAASNDEIALAWAQRYLAPTITISPVKVHADMVTYTHITIDEAALKAMAFALPDGKPISLQMQRTGRCVEGPGGRVVIHDSAGPMLYVVDCETSRVLAIASPTATNFRDLARQVRELVLSTALRDGWIVMHGSAVSENGRATVFLGNKGAGKSTLALDASELRGCSYISNDRVLLKATPDGILVRPYPMSVRLGGGTIRASKALSPHLHAYDHLAAALLPLDEQFAHTDKLELCLVELAGILGCTIEREATLERLVFPRLIVSGDPNPLRIAEVETESHSVLAEALFTPDPDGNGWLRDLLYGEHPADDSTYAAVGSAGALSVEGSAHSIIEHLFPRGTATPSVEPAKWKRCQQTAALICVMDHHRVDRRLKLSPWKTRAIHGGSVHEILLTADFAQKEQADEVHYLGFAEFGPGLLCVGDDVVLGDKVIGRLIGFDDTHLPNHMNIVVESNLRASGVDLEVPVGAVVVFRPVQTL